MYHYRKLKTVMLLLLACVGAKAQLADGKVYNFVNVGKGTSMNCNASGGVHVTATNESNYSQLWYAQSNGDGFTLRNLANGGYLYSPNATSNGWTVRDEVVAANSVFGATEVSGNYAVRVVGNTGTHNFAHADGGNNVVCWESSNQNSQWHLNEVSISEADLTANWNRLAEIATAEGNQAAWQGHLNTLFADKACTTLNSTYATMDEATLQAQEAYTALPSTLQQMVLKVRRGDDAWEENNYDGNKPSWDATRAKRYRVQLYEPYNEPEASAKALNINAHTNLNNPTGIFANMQEVLYVMVDGAVEDGATLYLASYVGHGQLNGYNNGVELHEGLNIIPSYQDGNNYCVNYVVHTFDTSKGTGNNAKARKLSDYEDLTIHIEGGHIQGYWNKMGDDLYGSGDKAADWDYLEERATQTDLTVMGEYMVLQFPLKDENTGIDGNWGLGSFFNEQVDINVVIDGWDNIMLWERFVMGLTDRETLEANDKKSPYSDKPYVFEYTGDDGDAYAGDYSDYYNLHGLAIAENSTFMSGGWKSSNYNCNTLNEIVRDLPTSAGGHWGPAHEIGHQHQGPLNMRGLTEVTNNLFSNIVLWYFGETTSRVNGSSGALSNLLANNNAGGDFFGIPGVKNDQYIWVETHMYYKLFLYYHVLGHNTKFYPRLFEMLRQDPMIIQYDQSGAESLLHFYKKCCYASGEDLTEFFRAYSFFKVMDKRLVGDYSDAEYTQTQEDIDAAIAEIKAWAKQNNAKENISILFVNDATEEPIKSHKGGELKIHDVVCAEVGSYASFATASAADYTYSVAGNTVTMTGDGGVGFAMYNEKGEIIAFSDNRSFTVSDELAAAIASGEVEFAAVNADSEIVEVKDVMDTDDTDGKYAALGELLGVVEEILALTDDTGNTYPGYYNGALMADFKAAYDNAKEVYDAKTVAAYDAALDVLNQEYLDRVLVPVPIFAGSTYVLTNVKYPAKSMASTLKGETTDNSATAQQWTFEAAEAADCYYIKNVSTNTYLGVLPKSGAPTFTATTTAEAVAYKAFDLGDGKWALQCQNVGNEYLSLHCDAGHSIVGWYHTSSENDGSWWKLTAVSVSNDAETEYKLQNLIEQTETLIGGMATVQEQVDIDLASCNVTSNAPEPGHGIELLYDNNPETYFHTVWKDSEVAEEHYVQVDLGEGASLAEFVWTYTTYTTQWGTDFPTEVKITGSNDSRLWSDIKTLRDLPTAQNTVYTSEALGSSADAYRYLRFTVTGTTSSGKHNGYYYFGLAEFGLNSLSTLVNLHEEFSSYVTSDEILTAYEELLEARSVRDNDSATGQDYTTAIEKLQEQYNMLSTAYNNAQNAALDAKKAELLTLISSANSLINSCGTVTYIPATLDGELALQTSNPDGDFYVWTNAQSSQEGPIAELIDGNNNSYFHTDYSGANSTDGLDHHITVNLGEGNEVSEFVFSYVTRHNAETNYPAIIKVYGGNGGSENGKDAVYEELAVFSSLPTGNTRTYTSEAIKTTKSYAYLRFMVTANNSNNIKGGHPFFHMAEFDLTAIGKPEAYDITLAEDAGNVSKNMLLEAYQEKAAAQSTHDMATTESQLQKAIDKLQAQCDALSEAKTVKEYADYSVVVEGVNAGGGVKYKEQNYTEGSTLNAPTALTAENLEAIPLNGYVARNITVEDKVITVTYNKVYTVQVVGGNGNGGVSYKGTNYTAGQTFDALQSAFTEENLTAVVPDGYTAKGITIDHEKSIVTVSFAAIPLVDADKYYTFECRSTQAHKDNRYIRDDGSVINGQSAEGSLFSFEPADEDNGYYIKSYVSDKYLNHVDGAVYATEEKLTVWTMAVPSHTPTARTFTVGNNLYLNNNGKDGNCTNLQSLDHSSNTGGAPNSGNACSLWTLTEGTPLDKSELQTLIDETNTLIGSCYTDGVLNYTNSQYVTEEYLGTIREAVEAAQAKYDSKATTASEYAAALEALQNTKTTLGETIAQAEEEKAAQYARLQEELRTWVGNIETLMEVCGSVDTDKTVPATTLSGTVALQTTAADEAFYLSTNALEKTEGSLEELIDDSLSTFFHSSWMSSVGAPHYLQVDMGEQHALKEFAFGYTTRDNGGGGPHPSVIEISGSNSTDDASFVTFATIDEGLPQTGGTSWATTDNIVVPGMPYRYLRFTVTQSAGSNGNKHSNGEYFFTMSKFSLTAVPTEEKLYAEVAPGAGSVTEALLVEVYGKKEDANELLAATPSREELEAAISELQTAYNALDDAYYTYDKTALQTLIAETQALVDAYAVDGTYVTETLVAATNAAITTAQGQYEARINEAEYYAALASLQEAYDDMQVAVTYVNLPVQLTVDAGSPALYKIVIARSETSVLAYDESDAMVAIADEFDPDNKAHGWYFMVAGDGQVYIMPYYGNNTTLALGTNDFNQGNSKVKAVEVGAEGYAQGWTITANANNEGWYNITTPHDGTTFYFSNHGGVDNKMGFYNNADDNGSRFKFEAVTFKPDAYYTLKNYYNGEVKFATGSLVGGDAVGYYPVALATAYNDAYNAATSLLESTEVVTGEEYAAAYNALKAANEALVMNMPVVGKYYTLVSTCTVADRTGRLVYADSENNMKYAADKNATTPEALWTFTAEGYLVNLQTGCSVSVGGQKLGDEPRAVEIRTINGDGQVLLIPAGSVPLHASNGNIISWGTYDHGSASSWHIVEVEEMSLVNFAVNVSRYEHTSLYLNYPVAIPEGVKAYIIGGEDISIDAEGVGTLKLTQLEGNVLPAQTAVIVEAAQGTHNFYYTDGAATDNVEGNLLQGSAYVTYREAEEGHNYYIFGVGMTEGVDLDIVGLYKNYVEYTAAGVYAEEGTAEATHYRMSANKVLFDWNNTEQQVTSFRFSVGGDETGIGNIGIEAGAVIYDLCGRRILEVVSPGLYIVNGEKRYVRVK